MLYTCKKNLITALASATGAEKTPPPPPLRSRGRGGEGAKPPTPIKWFEGPCSNFLKRPKAFAHF